MQTNITKFFSMPPDLNSNKTLIKDSICKESICKESKCIYIYTDGACAGNGFKGAKAGIGVYSNELLEISERISGNQTNQRAELCAILRALESIIIENYTDIYIYTDSQYSISCLTVWIHSWLKNKWISKKGNVFITIFFQINEKFS